MNIRDLRQKEASQAYLEHYNRKSILECSPRFGKCRSSMLVFDELKPPEIKILIPRWDIKASWDSEFKELGKEYNVEFLTFNGISKLNVKEDTLVVLDEIHELSIPKQNALFEKVKGNRVLGLSGTITNKTRNELWNNLMMDVCYTYTIDQGVEEGILSDYEIIIHKVPLDTKVLLPNKKTEKGQYNALNYLFKNRTGQQKFFVERKMNSIIQGSISKLQYTRHLLHKYRNERVLVFCGLMDIANKLEIPVYHSQNKDKKMLSAFCKGIIYNHMACVKMLQSGITIKPINRGIINYTSGNPEDATQKICRFLGFEYTNIDKKAKIDFLVTDEEYALQRMKTALLFFDENKIKYVNL